MKIVKTVADYRALGLQDVGFVPTMGALHEGHLSLIRAARELHEEVVVSIFVNPTQFAPHEDLSRYPRPFERDVELATAAGATTIFAPSVDEMYMASPVSIHVPVVTELYEGAHRPGHFDGVATVVAKLFLIVQPKTAYFGKKDLQQCAVIQKLVRDLNFPVNLYFCDTVREMDGLAKSSRNVYLSPEEREVAPELYRQLSVAKERVEASMSFAETENQATNELAKQGFVVDYFSVIDRNLFQPANPDTREFAIIVAARIGTTRLIDNVTFDR